VHYHLEHFTSVENSLHGRDRDWFAMAINEAVPEPTRLYPMETTAWRDWQAADKPDLSGAWHVIGEGLLVACADERQSHRQTDTAEPPVISPGSTPRPWNAWAQGSSVVI